MNFCLLRKCFLFCRYFSIVRSKKILIDCTVMDTCNMTKVTNFHTDDYQTKWEVYCRRSILTAFENGFEFMIEVLSNDSHFSKTANVENCQEGSLL